MGKAILLMLIAFGANVDAEDMLAEGLVDRASNNIVFIEMDDSVVAKAAGAQTSNQQINVANARVAPARQSKFTPVAAPKKGRLFGGTNNRNNNDPAVMAKLKGKAQGMYGTMGKNLVMSGGGPNAWDRFGEDNRPTRATFKLPKLTPIRKQETKKGRLFGGTNNRNNKDPAVMAKLTGPAAAMYSSRPMSYGEKSFRKR